MDKEISIAELVAKAEIDIDDTARYECESDCGELAKSIYKVLFDFYDDEKYSGDIIFTWKSPSLVQDGMYVGTRDAIIDNRRCIGNLFPNYKTDKKYSLNTNRNGYMGSFPHDYFDIYLDHIAKYAYGEKVWNIKEYYPLKRAIEYVENKKYFGMFTSFNDFLEKNYLTEIWNRSNETPFSDMEFEKFVSISENLMLSRGKVMLNKLIEKSRNV